MTKRKRTKWTTELIDEYLKENYPFVYLIPGQEYTNNCAKYWFYCNTHGPYEARWDNVQRKSGTAIGSQCPGCRGDKSKARNGAITKAFVGVTTLDGHTILEHIGYHQTPSDKKKGWIGKAIYRYKCAVCGNEDATAQGNNLKIPGNTTHCGCLGKRDGRLTFGKNEKKANQPCFFYIFSTVGGAAHKIGISNNVKRRASESYEQELFVSAPMPRASCWSLEQVILYQLRRIGLQFDLSDLPAFEEGQEAGGTEVIVSMRLDQLMQLYQKLAMEVLALGWEGLLDKYIPEPDMTMYQRLRWNGDQMEVVSGEKFEGHIYNSVFDI